jgi:type I restriction enzyme M protein
MNQSNHSSFIWSIAELLRGDYKQSDYGKTILPFVVLRRLDCVLEPTKAAVLAEFAAKKALNLPPNALAEFLVRKSGQSFFNSSPMDFNVLVGDAPNLKANLISYVNSFSENVRDIFEKYDFEKQIERLDSSNLLFQVVQRFAAIDLHPQVVNNTQMGLIFEELIRKFAELSNETAGEHFTPREVIRLMVDLLFDFDNEALTKGSVVRTIYDPTAGTGGMLSVADEHLRSMNPEAKLTMFGQELNPESYAICKADMLIKGQNVSNIVFGNTLSNDGHEGAKFDYMLSNPPFGVEWKKTEAAIRKEFEQKGFNGRFGPGLPRVSDGSLLFLLHLVSKMRDPKQGGSRIGIVLNGSPLFSGGAGSGESEIRKWVIENDWLETIVALPTDMFYNTGISTYIWILTNHKPEERKGKIQLIDGSSFFQKMRKSLGSKRKELGEADIEQIVKLYGNFEAKRCATITDEKGNVIKRAILKEGEPLPQVEPGQRVRAPYVSKIFKLQDFGYTTITVERPLRESKEATAKCTELFKAFIDDARRNGVIESSEIASDLLKVFAAILRLGRFADGQEALALVKKAKSKWSAEESVAIAPKIFELALEAQVWNKAWTLVEELDPAGDIIKDKKGNPLADSSLRDTENVPLSRNIEEYFKTEVLPHASDAWIDPEKSKVGYEIPFTRNFYEFEAIRSSAEIDAELVDLSNEIMTLLAGVSK